MSIEQAIFDALTADAAVAAIVRTRVYPSFVPQQEVLPAVTYRCISGDDEVTLDTDTGPLEDRWQITCWADTHAECVALFAAVQALWKRHSGAYGSVTILETYIQTRSDVPSLSDKDETWKGFGKFLDVIISYRES